MKQGNLFEGTDDYEDLFGKYNPDNLSEDEFDENKAWIERRVTNGDLWQLDTHRLYCGDATNPESYKTLMGGVKATLCFTDPPYGMKKEKDGVINDNLNSSDLLEFNKKWIPLTFENLTDNGSWYCWGIDEPLMDIYSEIIKPMQRTNKVTFRNLLTWDKKVGQGQLNADFMMYPIADEKCLFVVKGIQCLTLNSNQFWEEYEPIRAYLEVEIKKIGEKDQTIAEALGYKDGRTVNHWWNKSQFALPTKKNYEALRQYALTKGESVLRKEYDDLRKEYDDLRKEYDDLRAFFDNTHDNMNNVWHFDRTSKEEREFTGGHATPKPIALCGRGIKSSSRQGDLVLDVFGGSGSTLIACEQLGRHCRMMELDPFYCDVIIARWEHLTGKKAKLICNLTNTLDPSAFSHQTSSQ